MDTLKLCFSYRQSLYVFLYADCVFSCFFFAENDRDILFVPTKQKLFWMQDLSEPLEGIITSGWCSMPTAFPLDIGFIAFRQNGGPGFCSTASPPCWSGRAGSPRRLSDSSYGAQFCATSRPLPAWKILPTSHTNGSAFRFVHFLSSMLLLVIFCISFCWVKLYVADIGQVLTASAFGFKSTAPVLRDTRLFIRKGNYFSTMAILEISDCHAVRRILCASSRRHYNILLNCLLFCLWLFLKQHCASCKMCTIWRDKMFNWLLNIRGCFELLCVFNCLLHSLLKSLVSGLHKRQLKIPRCRLMQILVRDTLVHHFLWIEIVFGNCCFIYLGLIAVSVVLIGGWSLSWFL